MGSVAGVVLLQTLPLPTSIAQLPDVVGGLPVYAAWHRVVGFGSLSTVMTCRRLASLIYVAGHIRGIMECKRIEQAFSRSLRPNLFKLLFSARIKDQVPITIQYTISGVLQSFLSRQSAFSSDDFSAAGSLWLCDIVRSVRDILRALKSRDAPGFQDLLNDELPISQVDAMLADMEIKCVEHVLTDLDTTISSHAKALLVFVKSFLDLRANMNFAQRDVGRQAYYYDLAKQSLLQMQSAWKSTRVASAVLRDIAHLEARSERFRCSRQAELWASLFSAARLKFMQPLPFVTEMVAECMARLQARCGVLLSAIMNSGPRLLEVQRFLDRYESSVVGDSPSDSSLAAFWRTSGESTELNPLCYKIMSDAFRKVVHKSGIRDEQGRPAPRSYVDAVLRIALQTTLDCFADQIASSTICMSSNPTVLPHSFSAFFFGTIPADSPVCCLAAWDEQDVFGTLPGLSEAWLRYLSARVPCVRIHLLAAVPAQADTSSTGPSYAHLEMLSLSKPLVDSGSRIWGPPPMQDSRSLADFSAEAMYLLEHRQRRQRTEGLCVLL